MNIVYVEEVLRNMITNQVCILVHSTIIMYLNRWIRLCNIALSDILFNVTPWFSLPAYLKCLSKTAVLFIGV